MISQVSKVFLKNTIRYTESHNKMVEEDDMWKSHRSSKYREDRDRNSRKVRSSCTQIPRAHMDRADTDSRSYVGREDMLEGKRSSVWMQKLQEVEEKDPDRWGHGGFVEQNPGLFKPRTSSSNSDCDDHSGERPQKRYHKPKEDRWGHSGFKEQNPEYFVRSDSSLSSKSETEKRSKRKLKTNSPKRHSRKHSRKEKTEKHKKKHKKRRKRDEQRNSGEYEWVEKNVASASRESRHSKYERNIGEERLANDNRSYSGKMYSDDRNETESKRRRVKSYNGHTNSECRTVQRRDPEYDIYGEYSGTNINTSNKPPNTINLYHNNEVRSSQKKSLSNNGRNPLINYFQSSNHKSNNRGENYLTNTCSINSEQNNERRKRNSSISSYTEYLDNLERTQHEKRYHSQESPKDRAHSSSNKKHKHNSKHHKRRREPGKSRKKGARHISSASSTSSGSSSSSNSSSSSDDSSSSSDEEKHFKRKKKH